MEQSPEISQQGKRLPLLTPAILSGGTLKSFPQEANTRHGPTLRGAPRPGQSNAHAFPEQQEKQYLAQHPDKQEKAPGAASGPPVMTEAVQL